MNIPGPSLGSRRQRRDDGALHSLPLGTVSYDADIENRARRVATELVDSFPAIEAHEERIRQLIARALGEQDRASRVDEVLRRFSPSVQNKARHLARAEW
jgi:hypothetical protein